MENAWFILAFLYFLCNISTSPSSFLALLDYVSRAHELKFVHRPCRNYLRNYWANSFQISVVASPGPCPRRFLNFWNKTKNAFSNSSGFFSFSLTWGPIGAKTSKPYSSPKSLWIFSNFFWIFCSVVFTKVLFWVFEILSFWFFTNCFRINMGPYGSISSSASQLCQKLLSRFLSNFSCGFPWAILPEVFLNFWKKKCIFKFFRIFFRCHLHRALWGVSQAYSRLSRSYHRLQVGFGGICRCMCGDLMRTCLVWAERSTPDNFGC